MKKDNVYRNHEGYYDPTAGRAITGIMKDKAKYKITEPKNIYVSKRRKKYSGS